MTASAGNAAGLMSGQMARFSSAAVAHIVAMPEEPSHASGASRPGEMRKPRTPCFARSRIASRTRGAFSSTIPTPLKTPGKRRIASSM